MILDETDLPDRVTVVHRPEPTLDAYRNETFDWESASRDNDVPASLQPMTSTEDAQDRQATISGYRLFLLPTAIISPADRVELDDETYEVSGEPNVWRDGGVPDHQVVPLERITA